jgi:hypothetical protein
MSPWVPPAHFPVSGHWSADPGLSADGGTATQRVITGHFFSTYTF